jgi:hypothetical protein
MNPIPPQPNFKGVSSPSADFDSARDQIRSRAFTVVVDLSTARGPNAMLNLPISGNVFYIDTRANTGIARVHFQDQTALSCPFTVFPGFLTGVSFTQIAIENDAQPGQFLWIIFGTDLKLFPSNAAGSSIQNPMLVMDGARARTLNGTAWIWTASCGAVAAQFSHCQLFNPVGSGRVAFIDSLTFNTLTSGSVVIVGIRNSQIAVSAPGPVNKKLMLSGSPVSLMLSRIENNVAELVDTTIVHLTVAASSPVTLNFACPIELSPGTGIVVVNETVNVIILANAQFTDEAA